MDALAEGGRQRHRGELDQPLERGQALARLGGEIALEADALDQRREPAAAALLLAAGEDLLIDAVDVGTDLFQYVRGAVDDRLDQPEEHRRRGGAAAARLGGAGEELLLGPQLVVAQGGDAVGPGDHDGERRQCRLADVDAGQHRGGHEHRPVLQVEAARELDLLGLLARRQACMEKGFRRLVLGARRLVEVDPAHLGRQCLALDDRNRRGSVVGEGIGREHDRVPADGLHFRRSPIKPDMAP